MKSYRERAGVQLSTRSFYRELQRLVAEGLVETAANPSDADPRRAPYAITEAGKDAFDAWLAGPPGPAIGRYEDELSSRVLFLGAVDPVLVQKLIDGWKEELWLRSKMHERSCAALDAQTKRTVVTSFDALPFLLARNLKHLAADLEQLVSQERVYGAYLVELDERRRSLAQQPCSEPLEQFAVDAMVLQVETHLRWLQQCGELLQRVRATRPYPNKPPSPS